jgi:DNA-directed RNA polymerase sigma subunit (sigma70/sigma32)
MFNRVGRMAGQLQQAYGREPTLDEIGTAVGLPAEQVRELLHLMPPMVSLDERVGEDEGCPLAELVPDMSMEAPEELAEQNMLAERVQDLLLTLSPRERHVIQRRFGLETGQAETFTEIGRGIGVSRERIRQLEVVAFSKLRDPSRAEVLGAHLVTRPTLARSRRASRRGAPAR